MDRRGRALLAAQLSLAAVLLLGFGVLASVVVEGGTLRFDTAILGWFHDPATPGKPIGPDWLFEAVRDITSMGSFSVLGIVVIAVSLHQLVRGRKADALFVLVAAVSGTALNNGVKALFDRPRPDLTGTVEVFTSSFPSGHAMMSAVVYLTIAGLLASQTDSRGLRTFYLLFAVALTAIVGVSRVYLGVHYPTDILGGWALGAAWALLLTAAYSAWLRRRRQPAG